MTSDELSLHEAVASGSLTDVEELIEMGADLEELDSWGRTALLVAVQIGDIPRAKLLLEHGADGNAQGLLGTAVFYAVEHGQARMLQWLIESGHDVRQTDYHGTTLLAAAAEYGCAECVEVLVKAGVDVNQPLRYGTALKHAGTRETALLLLEAGADPQDLTFEARRALLGYPADFDKDTLVVSREDFLKDRSPRFGKRNPELMKAPFWEAMIRSGMQAYQGAQWFGESGGSYGASYRPVWCAQRFGQSLTFLPDGRIVQVAGEHEDSYDPNFCIYNDVFVHDADGSIRIYGYPEAVFPPTDFHTATLMGHDIYLIGSLGYVARRQYGETPVYRLDTDTFHIERVETTGTKPGWIYRQRAIQAGKHEIQVTGGKVVTVTGGQEQHSENATTFMLDIERRVWRTGR
jgi:hypothetical protein